MFAFVPPWPLVGLSKYSGITWGKFSDLAELPWYYPPLGWSDEEFGGAMVQPMVPKQELPLVLYQKFLGLL